MSVDDLKGLFSY